MEFACGRERFGAYGDPVLAEGSGKCAAEVSDGVAVGDDPWREHHFLAPTLDIRGGGEANIAECGFQGPAIPAAGAGGSIFAEEDVDAVGEPLLQIHIQTLGPLDAADTGVVIRCRHDLARGCGKETVQVDMEQVSPVFGDVALLNGERGARHVAPHAQALCKPLEERRLTVPQFAREENRQWHPVEGFGQETASGNRVFVFGKQYLAGFDY